MTSPTLVNTPRAATSEIQTCTLGSSYDPQHREPNPSGPIYGKTSSAGWRNLRMTVLTVDHNEIDEGNNLTDVGHSATNVNSAKRLRDALEHCNGRTEGARLALVHLGKSSDTNVNYPSTNPKYIIKIHKVFRLIHGICLAEAKHSNL